MFCHTDRVVCISHLPKTRQAIMFHSKVNILKPAKLMCNIYKHENFDDEKMIWCCKQNYQTCLLTKLV
jgi:hypothetical protein